MEGIFESGKYRKAMNIFTLKSSYKGSGSFIVELFSDTHMLSLSILIMNSQGLGIAKEVKDKRILGRMANRLSEL